MFLRAYPHGSASIAALAGGEIEPNRQVCPTFVGGSVKVRRHLVLIFGMAAVIDRRYSK